jgi:hypothetical protein
MSASQASLGVPENSRSQNGSTANQQKKQVTYNRQGNKYETLIEDKLRLHENSALNEVQEDDNLANNPTEVLNKLVKSCKNPDSLNAAFELCQKVEDKVSKSIVKEGLVTSNVTTA